MPMNNEWMIAGARLMVYNVGVVASGFFGSLIFITSRPLYLPQVGQAWWGKIKA